MEAEAVKAIVTGLKQAGINFVASLPSSSLAPVIHIIMKDTDFVHVPVANERDAIGICAGAWLGGKKPAFIGLNEGLVLATYPLLSTIYNFGGFPLLIVLDHRGDFGDTYPWYFASGIQLPRILESLEIPYVIVRESNKLIAEIVRGQETTEAYGKPTAILLSGEEFYVKHS